MSDVVEVDEKESRADDVQGILPGQKLRKARENRNLEQTDIAKELKIDLRFIKALEEEKFSELPQPVYTAGYVRAYSKLVGLVPDEIVPEYSAHQKASVKPKVNKKETEEIPSHYRQLENSLPKSFSVGHSQSDDRRKLNILISVLAIVVVFAIIWQVTDKSSESEVSTVDVEEQSNKIGDSLEESNQPADDQPSAAGGALIDSSQKSTVKLPLPKLEAADAGTVSKQPSQTSSEERIIDAELAQNARKITELSLHYTEDSWVDIRDATGKAIIRRLGVAGKSNTVSGVPPFEVLLGYSPGVSIEYDGKPYDLSEYSEKRVARFVLKSDGSVESSRATLPERIPARPRLERSEAFAIE